MGTLMDRRRALMANSQLRIPAKLVTFLTAVNNGAEIDNAGNEALSNAGITSTGVLVTTKKLSDWQIYDIVYIVVGLYGKTSTCFRYQSAGINALAKDSRYDGKITAGDTFYFVEVTP